MAYADVVAAKEDVIASWFPRTWEASFRMGAMLAIDAAYRKILGETQDAMPSGEWALVPVMTEEVNALVRKIFPETDPLPAVKVSTGAANAGWAAGSHIGLQRQVGDAGRSQALPG